MATWRNPTTRSSGSSRSGEGGGGLEELFHKLRVANLTDPFLILIQHSQSFALRYGCQATSATTAATTTRIPSSAKKKDTSATDAEVAIYRRAGLRTPAENAQRDLQAGTLWLDYILNLLLYRCPPKGSGGQGMLVFVQTKPSSSSSSGTLSSSDGRARMIDLSVDPFGWDEEEVDVDVDPTGTQSDERQQPNLERLDAVTRAIEKAIQDIQQQSSNSGTISNPPRGVPVVLESLTPFLMRHGFSKTLHFLKKIMALDGVCPLLVPVLVAQPVSGGRDLSSCRQQQQQQHRILEDLASAVLCLHHGEATLLRQGVRERANFVRRLLHYDVVLQEDSADRLVIVAEPPREDASPGSWKGQDANDDDDLPLPPQDTVQEGTRKQQQRPRRMELAIEEDHPSSKAPSSRQPSSTKNDTTTTLSSSSRPHIFIQDDDPEFDDYDEEDPDEDLEI